MGVQRTPVNVNVSRGVLWWHSPPNAPMLSQNQKGFQGSIKSLQATRDGRLSSASRFTVFGHACLSWTLGGIHILV